MAFCGENNTRERGLFCNGRLARTVRRFCHRLKGFPRSVVFYVGFPPVRGWVWDGGLNSFVCWRIRFFGSEGTVEAFLSLDEKSLGNHCFAAGMGDKVVYDVKFLECDIAMEGIFIKKFRNENILRNSFRLFCNCASLSSCLNNCWTSASYQGKTKISSLMQMGLAGFIFWWPWSNCVNSKARGTSSENPVKVAEENRNFSQGMKKHDFKPQEDLRVGWDGKSDLLVHFRIEASANKKWGGRVNMWKSVCFGSSGFVDLSAFEGWETVNGCRRDLELRLEESVTRKRKFRGR